ncbi:MAG: hypothetical protein H6718_11435 [Polyangiaceae bacterium]|nr:hypothetical protein [Myxococcales bacterium]MCB9586003.1 hypothetical protein [Polyangiaceae bacterium]
MFPLLFCAFAVACGSDDDAPPPKIQVTLLDRETGQPVAEASVSNGEGTALSDAEGVAQVSKDSELSITATGYLPLEVSGVSGDSLTLPLTPSKVRQRTVRGSIVGWDALPALGAGKYRLAQIRGAELNDAARIHERVALGISDATCVARNTPTACAFELNVHADVTSVFAVIVEGDDTGTPDDMSDDTLTGTGFGVMTFNAGDDLLSDQALTMIPTDQLGQVAVKPGAGTGSVSSEPVGVPGLTVNKQVLVFPTFEGNLGSYAVPIASSFTGGDEATLWGVSLAQDTQGSSFAVERGLPLDLGVSQTVDVDVASLQAAPSLQESASGYSVEVPAGGLLLIHQDGKDYLNFSGSRQLANPTISAWIQLCEGGSTDAYQALSQAPRCSARVID